MAFLEFGVYIQLVHHCGKQPLIPNEDTKVREEHSMGLSTNVTNYYSLHNDCTLKISFT
jgi:hypothetical protein